MSMTLEEAIELLCYGDWLNVISEHIGKQDTERIAEAMSIVGKALRTVSREQVEKMKKAPVKGEYDELYAPTYKCPECGFWDTGMGNFCRNCGCLHTDEAVQMVMERMEKLHEDNGCP